MKSLPLFLIFFLAPFACADVIVLDDGTRLEGKAQKTDSGWTITDDSGKQTTVAADHVKSFELSGHPDNSAGAATDQLVSMRRGVDNMSDLDPIIQRYQRFIDAHAGTPAADDARADLAVWQQRKSEGQIKVGNNWMTQADRQKLISDQAAVAQKVRDLLAQGRVQQADAAIQQALAVDAGNPSILYLQGYELANQQKNNPARTAFDKVRAVIPNHAPTLNNLAVIMFRQKFGPAGMNFYLQAMQSGPPDKDILNNVAEALNTLTPDELKSPPAQHAKAMFDQQDAELAKSMGDQGLYRWGATWITKKQLDQCQYAEQQIQGRLDTIQQDFDNAGQQISTDQGQINTDQDEMTQLQMSSYGTDNRGRTYALPLAGGRYGELQDDVNRLKADIQRNQLRQVELRAQAGQIQKTLPVPKYTGTQQLIGPEGTPLLDEPPATQPAL